MVALVKNPKLSRGLARAFNRQPMKVLLPIERLPIIAWVEEKGRLPSKAQERQFVKSAIEERDVT
jgi:hypothetical protein